MIDLYQAALAANEGARGFYNNNVRLDTPSGPVIVRIPLHGADTMDLRVWPEYEVLGAIGPYVGHAPRLLHVSESPAFQVHEFIPGELVDDIAPRGERVPSPVLSDVVELFAQLATVPREKLPNLPPCWPATNDTPAFANLLSDVTQQVYETFIERYESLFATFGIPGDPLASIRARWPELTRRPFGLVHADVHRKNMILSTGRVVFLDWELALWGDPVYELAVHFHKMSYHDDERETVLDGWLKLMPTDRTRDWQQDLGIYLAHERVKSAIVDTVRYTQLIWDGGLPPEQRDQLTEKLTAKLNAAGTVWQRDQPFSTDTVRRLIHSADLDR
ncbi:aminoglycoside phosphotransferase family protein [Sphaerisporangium sp. NBC_01403]|uniref:phosphotransferase family protein n=1 Tax=Sphaerisporangium sp. NBC_01403 TaxID=2903599 RepID=UPI003245EFF4